MSQELPVLLLALGVSGVLLWWLVASAPSRAPRARLTASHPRLEAARQTARAQRDVLVGLFAAHPERCRFKVRVPSPGDAYRGEWADLQQITRMGVAGVVRGVRRDVHVGWEELEDWLVELPDGTVRGGFTVVAAWRVREAWTGQLPDEARSQLPRFLDAHLA